MTEKKRYERKITFWNVCIEVTRQCNLQCPHCYRGDAQNITLAFDAIDDFLDQTEMINFVQITGGEPFLALDQIEYFVDGIIRRNTAVLQVAFITNGTVINRRLREILFRLSDYIKGFREPTEIESPFVCVSVSADKYHDTNSDDSYKRLKMLLYPKVFVGKMTIGDSVVVTGRARSNPDQFNKTRDVLNSRTHLRKIQVRSAESEMICPEDKHLGMYYPEQVYIPCPIYLDACGKLRGINSAADNGDYAEYEKHPCICSTSENIIDAIKAYNIGKMECAEHNKFIGGEVEVRPSVQGIDIYENVLKSNYNTLRSTINGLGLSLNTYKFYASLKKNWERIANEKQKRIYPHCT